MNISERLRILNPNYYSTKAKTIGDAGGGEKVKIHTVRNSKKSWVRRAVEKGYDRLHPEVTRLRDSLHWIDELHLSRRALEWIGQCKDLSDEEKKKDQSGEFKTGFDLIKLHLLMLRERKMVDVSKVVDQKRDFLRKEIEINLDSLLNFMMREKETWNFTLPKNIYHYIKGDTVELKSIALTKLLGEWHQFGDHNFGLRRVRGIPYKNNMGLPPDVSDRVFLDKLQNIDRPEYWYKEGRRYEKDQLSRRKSHYAEWAESNKIKL